jgi:hypothetical protein
MTPMRLLLLLSGGSAFSPLSLFAGGVVGAWYDPSDLSTMFQNSNGTTAVAVGDPVGYIADKSGNGKHATQATAAARPFLRQDAGGRYYLEFNGAAYNLSTSAIDFSATDKMTVIAGANAPTATVAIFLELTANAVNNNGGFNISDNDALGGLSTYRTRGTVSAGGGNLAAPAPDLLVGTWQFDNAAAQASQAIVRINGATVTDTAVGTTTAGNYANAVLYIGSRAGGSVFFNGHLYGLIVAGATKTAAEIANGEAWMNGKTAAY